MTTLFKFLHIAAISVWAAGLICYPFLNRRLHHLDTTDLHRLHAMVRFFYVVILSPAAFIAIGSGIVLIFQQQTFTTWFSLKLLLVGLLAGMHLWTGRVVLQWLDKASRQPAWRHLAMSAATTLIVTGIVIVVLVKPSIELRAGAGVFAPGHLGQRFEHSATRTPVHAPALASLSRIDHQPDAMIEDQLAAMPSSETREYRGQHRQAQSMRQDLFGRGEPQSPIGARNGEQSHRCDGVRPATHAIANAFHCQQLGRPDERGKDAEPERESGAPHAGAQKELIAVEPIEHIDAQRREH